MSDAERAYLDRYLSVERQQVAPEQPEDVFFEGFCIEQILKTRDLDLEQLASGRVGGSHDGGVDAIYLFANGELVREDIVPSAFKGKVALHLVVIQATRSSSGDMTRILKLNDMVNHLFDLTKDIDAEAGRYNPALRAAVKQFRDWFTALVVQLSTLNISFYLASKGDAPHKNMEARAKELEARVEELYPGNCEVAFVGVARLLELTRQSRRTPLVLEYTKDLSSGQMGDAYVCLVPLPAFAAFLTTPDGEQAQYILQPNVRAYLGERGINKQIRATLENPDPQDEFWWLNNGVTIVASNASRSTKAFTLQDPRIVNGLQTSREIYNYARSKGDISGDPRHVLVRIIDTKSQGTVDRILRATNSQTKIPSAYLHGTEEVHEKIGLAFPAFGIFYERLQNQFAEERKPRDKIITLPYLMQALIAIWLQQPNQARGAPTRFAEKEYKNLFHTRYPPEMYANAALIMKAVERFLRTRVPALEPAEQLNLKFYVAMYATCMLAQQAWRRPRLEQLDITGLTYEVLESSLSVVEQEYRALIGGDRTGDQVARGAELVANIKAALSRKLDGRRG